MRAALRRGRKAQTHGDAAGGVGALDGLGVRQLKCEWSLMQPLEGFAQHCKGSHSHAATYGRRNAVLSHR